jgi:hypothetical protein
MTINQLAKLTDWDVGNISRLERDMQGYSEASIRKSPEHWKFHYLNYSLFRTKTILLIHTVSVHSRRKGEVMCTELMLWMFLPAQAMGTQGRFH